MPRVIAYLDALALAREGRTVFVDARSAGEYALGHLEGAVHLDLYDVFADDRDAFLRAGAAAAGRAGLDGTERAVVYERGLGQRAARLAHLLEWIGHRRVHVLKGGVMAALEAGTLLTTATPAVEPREFRVETDESETIWAGEIAARLGDPGIVLLDVREWGEFTGERPRADSVRAGRIPGATWLEWVHLMDGSRATRTDDDVRERLAGLGVTPDKEIVVYCNRGARAAAGWLALKNLGYPRVRNYLGSWHDWSRRLELPVETGEE